MGFTYCKNSVGSYFSCLEGFCTCTWGPRSVLLLVRPLNKWGAEISFGHYSWWDKAFRLTEARGAPSILLHRSFYKTGTISSLDVSFENHDQFHSLCELMHLTIASPLAGESSLEIIFLSFRVQRPGSETSFRRGQMMPSGKLEHWANLIQGFAFEPHFS